MIRAALLAFILAMLPALAEGQAVPLPGVKLVSEGCSPCWDGDRVRIVLHAFRPGVAQATVEVRAVVRAPDGAVSPLPISGTTVTLPAGPSSTQILDMSAAGTLAGVYLIEAAFIDPLTGATLSRHTLPIAKEP